NDHDFRFAEDVLPTAFLWVNQNPQYADHGQPRNPGTDVTQRTACPANWLVVYAAYTHAPGQHTQRLSDVNPEPAEKQVGDVEQVGAEQPVTGFHSLAASKGQQNQDSNHP